MSRDKRRFQRAEFKVEVSLETDHNFWAGFTENISEGGLFIATLADRALGDPLSLEFTPPGYLEPLQVQCVVRWVRKTNPMDEDAPPGLGVEFLDLPGHAAAEINRFIHRRAPLFFDDTLL